MSRSTLVVGLGPTRPAVTIGLADSAKQLTAMALHLSEPSSVTDPAGGQTPNTAQWVIEVYVQYQEGEYLLGIVTSTSVAAGSRAARTLALAYCPGAKTWRVVVFGPIGATCAVRLSSDECCNGGFVGLAPANDGQVQTLSECASLSTRVWDPFLLGPLTKQRLSSMAICSLTCLSNSSREVWEP
jgi:hypothetical protein